MSRILIVDDDSSIRDILLEVLRIEGYEVASAPDGQTAVEMVGAFSPLLILMDLMMPRLDGVEATARIKADPQTRDIPIIAMSAGVNLRNTVDGLCADALLAKPFDLDELLAQVTLHLRASARRIDDLRLPVG